MSGSGRAEMGIVDKSMVEMDRRVGYTWMRECSKEECTSLREYSMGRYTLSNTYSC